MSQPDMACCKCERMSPVCRVLLQKLTEYIYAFSVSKAKGAVLRGSGMAYPTACNSLRLSLGLPPE